MTIQQAIEKAIEGGWDKDSCVNAMAPPSWNFSKAMLDPLFWHSLGKAMGWKNETCRKCWMTRDGKSKNFKDYCYCTDPDITPNTPPDFIPTWKFQWNRFIDKLANGGTAEQFFEELSI